MFLRPHQKARLTLLRAHELARPPVPVDPRPRTLAPARPQPARVAGSDPVNHPSHYALPNGLEAIDVLEALHRYGTLDFRIAAAIQYLWRLCIGKENSLQDAKKAVWYIERWIKQNDGRRSNGNLGNSPVVATASTRSKTTSKRRRSPKRSKTAKPKKKKKQTKVRPRN